MTRECPESSTLAAYVDGRLKSSERRVIDEHLSTCDSCLDLIADVLALEPADHTADTVVNTRARRWSLTSWPRPVAAPIVVVASLVLLIQLWGSRQVGDPAHPSESMLEEGVPVSAPGTNPRWSADLVPWSSGRSTWRVPVVNPPGVDVRRGVTAVELRSEGARRAMAGDWNGAVALFVGATHAQPADPRLHSDAAASYLARAHLPGRAGDSVRAFAAAERAVLLDPTLAQARFNRALALERLALRSLARTAWRDYLRLDSTSVWSAEARRHNEWLSRPRPMDRWPALEAALQRSPSLAVVEDAIRLNPSAARRLLETRLFTTWATVAASGADASTEREDVRRMADAFRRLTGDALYVDAVAAVDGAQAQGPVAARALAAAHLEYARAAELLSQDRFTAARPRLEASLGGLVTANSPYAARARLDLEVVAYYSGQGPALTPSLVSLADEAARRSYTFVVSRSLWLQGLVAFTAGQYADAQVVWERMLATGEAMRDAEECAAAHGLLANLLHQLASNDEAWRHRIAYLDILSDYRADRIRFGLLMSAAGHALKEDAASALPIQEAVIEDALQSGRTTTLPEAYAQRAGILGALGRTRDARADLEAAWRHWGAIDDPGLRARLNAALATAEATILERIEDPAALQAAARAVELAKAREDTMRLPGLYLALARAQSRAGRVQQAEVTTDAGLELLQRSAPGVPTEQAASDDLVGLSGLAMQAALRDGDIARAYRHGAVARARTPAHESDRSTGDVLLLQRRLGPRRAVLALNQLDEELVVWLVTHSSVQISRRRLTWTQSQHLVELQHAEINLALEKPRASAALFKEVVGPFRDSLAQLDHVLIDPDAPFRSASFPALFDRSTGRFLIEDTDLTVEGGRPRGLRADGRTPFVDIPPGATPTDAIASWRAADSQALIRIHARAISNDQFPQLSHLVFADRPGLPHTGMVLVRDLPRLPEVRAVFLPNVDTGQHQISRAGTVDLASALLERGATHVITFLTPGAPGPDEWVPRLNAQGSVPATVAHLQRDELRRAHRLGTWSRLVVYGSLH